MRMMGQSRRMAAGAVFALLAATGAAGCSFSPHPSAAASSSPASSAPAPSTAATPTATASSPPASSSSPAASPGQVQNLLVTPAVRSELTAAFAAFRKIPASEVGGTYPHSVYYAYVPATDTYWAMATFDPSSTDSFNVQLSFQDAGGVGLFTRTGAGSWQAQGGSMPPVCGEVGFFPPSVLKAWAQPTSAPASC